MHQDIVDPPFTFDEQTVSTWQELLEEIIDDRQERHRISYALGIRSHLLSRWVRNEAVPSLEQFRQLVASVRPAYRVEMQRLVEENLRGIHVEDDTFSESEIPQGFYRDVVRGYATFPGIWRTGELQQIVLRQIVNHMSRLDSHDHGIVALLITCVVPQQTKIVRSLRVVSSFGSGLLAYRLWEGFLGIESHSGYVVARGLPAALPHTRSQEDALATLDFPDDIHSVIAVPLRRGERIAGCITVCSPQPEAFASSHLALLQDYADLLTAFRFEERELYTIQQIRLGVMPPHALQRVAIGTFQQRVASVIHDATQQSQSMSFQQAEVQAWQDIEGELLRFTTPLLV